MPKIIENPREAILDHAKAIIIKEGYDKLTIRKVANDSGMSIGTIYNYFPTKRELIAQLMEDYWNSYLEAIDKIDKNEPNLYLKILSIYRELEEFIKTFKEVWVKNASGEHPEEIEEHRKNFVVKLNKRFESILVEAQKAGLISLTIDSYTIANFIISNFFMMALVNYFQYEDFEKILKELFE